MNDTSKIIPPGAPATKGPSREKPQTAELLPLLKDLNLLQARVEKEGYEFLSYLLQMAILEAQSLASGGAGERDGSAPDRGGAKDEGG